MVNGIPSTIYSPLRETLKKCNDVFSSQQTLWSIFSEERLQPWQDSLPEAYSLNQRVDFTISYLSDAYRRGGESVLVLFLEALAERYNPEDSRYEKLNILIDQLKWVNQLRLQKSNQQISLEANPNGSQMIPIAEAEKVLLRARSVAKIDIPRIRNGRQDGGSTGTGWLIAPGLLITCWHVLETKKPLDPPIELSDLQAQLANMLLTFDYTAAGKGIQYGVEVDSLYPGPDVEELDYALLRLKDRNDKPLASYAYQRLDRDAPLTNRSSLYIIQHPLGQSQQVAGDSFERMSPVAGRILYNTPTEPGTSGAPVFNRVNWRVIALHNGENKTARLREGTLIKSILSELEQKNPDLYREIMKAQDAEE